MAYTPPGVRITPIAPKGTSTLFIPEFSPKILVVGKPLPYKVAKYEELEYNGAGYYPLAHTSDGIKEIIQVVDSLGQVFTSYPKWLSWYWTSNAIDTVSSLANVDGAYDKDAGGTWILTTNNATLSFECDGSDCYMKVSGIADGDTVTLRLVFDKVKNWIPYHINDSRDASSGPGYLVFGFENSSTMTSWDATVSISDGSNTASSSSINSVADLQHIDLSSLSNISYDILGGVSYLEFSLTNSSGAEGEFKIHVIKIGRNDSNINKMVWFSDASEVPANGSTVYVTYYYYRPASDYSTIKTYPASIVEAGNPWEEAVEDLGDPSEDNELSVAMHYLFNVVGIRRASVVMTRDNTPLSMIEGWNIAYETDFDYVILLGDISGQEGTLRAKIVDAFRPENARERFLFVGLPKLDATMSVSDKLTKAMEMASALHNQYTLFTVPDTALYSLTYVPLFEKTAVTVTYELPGYFWALGVAALKASFEDPSMPLIRKQILGFKLKTEDAFWFNDSTMYNLADVGITVIRPADLGSDVPIILEDLTTDMTDEYTSSFAVNDITMFVTKKVRKFLDKNFIGKKMNDRAAMLSAIQSALASYLQKTFVNRQIITDVLSLTASISPDDPRKILIRWVLQYPAPVRNIEGTFTYTM